MTAVWVDLPETQVIQGRGEDFVHIGTFPSRDKARMFLLETYGMPLRVADFFISDGAEDTTEFGNHL